MCLFVATSVWCLCTCVCWGCLRVCAPMSTCVSMCVFVCLCACVHECVCTHALSCPELHLLGSRVGSGGRGRRGPTGSSRVSVRPDVAAPGHGCSSGRSCPCPGNAIPQSGTNGAGLKRKAPRTQPWKAQSPAPVWPPRPPAHGQLATHAKAGRRSRTYSRRLRRPRDSVTETASDGGDMWPPPGQPARSREPPAPARWPSLTLLSPRGHLVCGWVAAAPSTPRCF